MLGVAQAADSPSKSNGTFFGSTPKKSFLPDLCQTDLRDLTLRRYNKKYHPHGGESRADRIRNSVPRQSRLGQLIESNCPKPGRIASSGIPASIPRDGPLLPVPYHADSQPPVVMRAAQDFHQKGTMIAGPDLLRPDLVRNRGPASAGALSRLGESGLPRAHG